MLHIWNEINETKLRFFINEGTEEFDGTQNPKSVSVELLDLKTNHDETLAAQIFNIENEETYNALVDIKTDANGIVVNATPHTLDVKKKGQVSAYKPEDEKLPLFSLTPRYKNRTDEEKERYKDYVVNCVVLVTKPGTRVYIERSSNVGRQTTAIFNNGANIVGRKQAEKFAETTGFEMVAKVDVILIKYPVWCNLKRPLNILVESALGHKCIECTFTTQGDVSFNTLKVGEYDGDFPKATNRKPKETNETRGGKPYSPRKYENAGKKDYGNKTNKDYGNRGNNSRKNTNWKNAKSKSNYR